MVTNVEDYISSSGKRFPLKYITPLLSNHAPWLEDSPDLMADDVQQRRDWTPRHPVGEVAVIELPRDYPGQAP